MSTRLNHPAVVTDFLTTGIGQIHSLHLAGVDVVSVAPTWPPLLCLGRYSRCVRRSVKTAGWDVDSWVRALEDLGRDFDGMGVLFPSHDDHVEMMMAARTRLSGRYHVPVSPEFGPEFFEKNWQYSLADRVGVPTPRYTVFRGGDSPDLAGFRFPLILKPSSRLGSEAAAVFRLRILASPAELERTLDELATSHAGRSFQIAENIPGPPDQLWTVGSYSNREGRVLRSFTGRKLSQHPYTHGICSVAEARPMPEEVVGYARALLEEARFHGISQVELKYDPRDDRYKLIEINPRAWAWVKLAAFSGINLPLIQYYDLLGDPRLAHALAQPQRYDRFFVNEHYVILNHMAEERELIARLAREREMVRGMGLDGERLLPAVSWAFSHLKRLTHSLVGTQERGANVASAPN